MSLGRLRDFQSELSEVSDISHEWMIMSPGLEKWFANCNPMQYNQSFKYLPKSAKAIKTLAECTLKNGDLSMTSRNGPNYIFWLHLLRWATKRLSRSTWHADI